jgi:hypothetical protein
MGWFLKDEINSRILQLPYVKNIFKLLSYKVAF